VLVFLIWFLTPTAEFRARAKVSHLFVSCLRVLLIALPLILSGVLDQEWLNLISTIPVSAQGSLAALLPALCLVPWFLGAVFLSICRTRRALVFFGPHLGLVFQAAGFCHSQSLVGLSISNRLVPGGSVRHQKSPLVALFSSVDLSGFSGNRRALPGIDPVF
jgi:hypothetical protein